jgi:hypothetical protein
LLSAVFLHVTAALATIGGFIIHARYGDRHGPWRIYVDRPRTSLRSLGPTPSSPLVRESHATEIALQLSTAKRLGGVLNM